MSDDGTKDRFFRERRLLLGTSAVLLAHQLLGITVTNSAETLGLRFEIADPSKIWWAVWAVWLWTAVCVVQQLNSLRPRTTYPKDRDDETRDRLSDWIAVKRVRREAMKHLRPTVPRTLRPTFEVVFVDRVTSTIPGGPDVLYACVSVTARWRCDDPNMAAAKASEFGKAMETAGFDMPGGSTAYESGECTFTKTANVRIMPIRDERLIRWASVTWTWFSTSFVTDYFAPLLIAAAPLAVAVGQAVIHYWSVLRG